MNSILSTRKKIKNMTRLMMELLNRKSKMNIPFTAIIMTIQARAHYTYKVIRKKLYHLKFTIVRRWVIQFKREEKSCALQSI